MGFLGTAVLVVQTILAKHLLLGSLYKTTDLVQSRGLASPSRQKVLDKMF